MLVLQAKQAGSIHQFPNEVVEGKYTAVVLVWELHKKYSHDQQCFFSVANVQLCRTFCRPPQHEGTMYTKWQL